MPVPKPVPFSSNKSQVNVSKRQYLEIWVCDVFLICLSLPDMLGLAILLILITIKNNACLRLHKYQKDITLIMGLKTSCHAVPTLICAVSVYFLVLL